MDAPTPDIDCSIYEKDIKDIQFLKDIFYTKLNEENYSIMIGSFKEFLVIKVIKEKDIKNNYISYFTYEQLKNISKAIRYFDDINDIINFMVSKGKNNEIILKKENNKIYIEFKIILPNGKEDNVFLEIKSKEITDKEMISLLVKKVEYLEKEMKILQEQFNISITKNKNDIALLFEEIELLKSKNKRKKRNKNKNKNNINEKKNIINEDNKNKDENNKNNINGNTQNNINEKNNNNNEESFIEIDSKITNINEIDFIINHFRKKLFFKNFKFTLLYRATKDGDDTIKLHKICDHKNDVIIFMKSEQGNIYGGFSHIGWESRNKKSCYQIDNRAFLFSLSNKKLFEAIKGKAAICWINNDEYGLCFDGSLSFRNHFLTKETRNLYNDISLYFKNCKVNDFNSGINECKLSELEVFQIIH